MSCPSSDDKVTLEVVQVKIVEECGSLWLARNEALQWERDVHVADACEMDGLKV